MQCSCTKTCDCKSFEALSKLLANSYVLFLKTQNIHWNITGSCFRSIHLMTEEHYKNLFSAIDGIAERIKMIGGIAPATFEEFSKLASFSDKLEATTAAEMLNELLLAHKLICRELGNSISEMADSKDFGTVDILTDRLAFHEKVVWMLNATLCSS